MVKFEKKTILIFHVRNRNNLIFVSCIGTILWLRGIKNISQYPPSPTLMVGPLHSWTQSNYVYSKNMIYVYLYSWNENPLFWTMTILIISDCNNKTDITMDKSRWWSQNTFLNYFPYLWAIHLFRQNNFVFNKVQTGVIKIIKTLIIIDEVPIIKK